MAFAKWLLEMLGAVIQPAPGRNRFRDIGGHLHLRWFRQSGDGRQEYRREDVGDVSHILRSLVGDGVTVGNAIAHE